jgi:hypothetical protein
MRAQAADEEGPRRTRGIRSRCKAVCNPAIMDVREVAEEESETGKDNGKGL